MAYRNLFIENQAHIKVRNEQLIVTTDCEHSIPIEDINSIILENLQSTISAAVLSKLSQKGAALYVCDDKHLPCAILLPFAQHSRNSVVIKKQEALNVPLKKQLWQQIIRAKILNQSKCLRLLHKGQDAIYLENLSKKVLSGDSSNIEAIAANYYFKHVFNDILYRNDEDDIRNAFLNYGYSILRGHIARLLVSYGFMPMKGIHHDSSLNAFNLADDFIEPVRPVVDLFTASLDNYNEFSSIHKKALYNLLNMNIESGSQIHSVAYACERMIKSFVSCCQKTSKELLLPSLLELKQHTYE